MKLADFVYPIPKQLIAEYPIEPKEAARMMTLNRRTGEMEDKTIGYLFDFLQPGDCVVVNETKVFPDKIIGNKEKTDAEIEVLMLRELNKTDNLWDVLVDPARKVRIGNKIYFDNYKFYCEVIDNTTNRGRTVRYSYNNDLLAVSNVLAKWLYLHISNVQANKKIMNTIKPNMLTQNISPQLDHLLRDCIFPIHFFSNCKKKAFELPKVNMSIGQAIFDTIEVEDLTKHRMYAEPFEITRENSEIINKTLKAKKKVIAIGSSVARALESSNMTTTAVKPNRGWTDKFILSFL